MTSIDGEQDPIRTYIIVYLGAKRIKQYTHVDSGVDINSISYDIWESLDNKPLLLPTKLKVATFAGDYKGAEGYFDLTVFVNDIDVSHRFYVMKPGEMVHLVILGLPWQRTYNAIPQWKKDGLLFTTGEKEAFEPFLAEECYFDDTDSETEDSEEDESITEPDCAAS